MCRTFFEILYMTETCRHGAYWETPSPDAACNGIRHIIVQNRLKPCKHCWVAAGNKKKAWRRVAMERRGADRRIHYKLHLASFEYPIQSISCVRQSDCPTWRPRYKWHTRDWATRAIVLKRLDIWQEHEELVHRGVPEHGLGSIHHIDEDTDESRLLRLVEPENVTRGQTHCTICTFPFVHEDPEERCLAGPGGLRQLPCTFNHAFCLECIREHFLTITRNKAMVDDDDPPLHQCPFCFKAWTVKIATRRDVRGRLAFLFGKYFDGMQEHFANAGTGPLDARRFPAGWRVPVIDYVGCSAVILLLVPMFFTVEHSMHIWNSKYGKLPLLQTLVVGLTGTVLQSAWLLGLICSPAMIPPILAYEFMMEIRKERPWSRAAWIMRSFLLQQRARTRIAIEVLRERGQMITCELFAPVECVFDWIFGESERDER